MAILFGNTGGRNQSKNLLEFKAGKMQLKGNMVHPDKRKGLVYVHQTDDSLMHFCWKDRTSGVVEDDLIIFPDDVEYKRVAQCTTGRVYVLKFKSTNRKCFFWMQEPKTDKDDEYCQKVNEYLNNPPTPGANRSGGSTPGTLQDLAGEGDLQNLFSAMNQQQFMQLLGGMGGVGGMANLSSLLSSHGLGSQFGGSSGRRSLRRSAQNSASTATTTATTTSATAAAPSSTSVSTTTASVASAAATTTTTTAASSSAATTTTTTTASSKTATTTATTAQPVASASSSQIQLSDLQNILSGINVQPGENQQSSQQAVDLSTAMTSEALQPILSNPEFKQRLQAFLPNTGDDTGASADQLRNTVQSPQFQQAVSMFSAALQSGQLGPLMQQFGLGEEVVTAASQGDLEAFITALQSSQNKGNDTNKDSGKDKDDDEEMSLD